MSNPNTNKIMEGNKYDFGDLMVGFAASILLFADEKPNNNSDHGGTN